MKDGRGVAEQTDCLDVFHVAALDRLEANVDADKSGQELRLQVRRILHVGVPITSQPTEVPGLSALAGDVKELGLEHFAIQFEVDFGLAKNYGLGASMKWLPNGRECSAQSNDSNDIWPCVFHGMACPFIQRLSCASRVTRESATVPNLETESSEQLMSADALSQFGDATLIDLSVPLEDQSVSEPLPGKIRYIDHANEGLQQMQQFFGVSPDDLVYSNGEGWAIEEIHAITHTGTHVDAPYHYAKTAAGEPAKRIDEVPLDWCFAPGVRLDVRQIENGTEITVDDLKAALSAIDYELKPRDIVLLQTGADARIDSPEYFNQPGLGRDGTLWLVEQGVKVIGIDAYTLDRPFKDMVADYKKTGDGRFIWPAHFAGVTAEYCQIEKLANLDEIPRPHGFLVSCLPVKIKAASAGWCRAVAIV